jgi:hypothetical protein
MMLASASAFLQSPLGATLVGVFCAAMLAIAGSAIKIVAQLSGMESTIKSIHDELHTLRTDPDVMRWSNYGRADRAAVMAEQREEAER